MASPADFAIDQELHIRIVASRVKHHILCLEYTVYKVQDLDVAHDPKMMQPLKASTTLGYVHTHLLLLKLPDMAD